MNKKRVLVPIDGTERSMHSLYFIKELFPKDTTEIILMHVREIVFFDGMAVSEEIKTAQELGEEVLNVAEEQIREYDTRKYFTFGYAAEEILKKASEEKIDFIVMTKSTKKGLTRMIGSVTASVVKKAHAVVMIVPE
ncbi:MAG: universal stress protein [Clostridiales bacterium]|nr:universal stress protein [Clostridiales bacterium]